MTWACWNHRQSVLNQALGMVEISTGGIKAEDDEWQRKIYDLLHESICTRNLILFAACLPFCPICRSFDSCFEEPQLSDTSGNKNLALFDTIFWWSVLVFSFKNSNEN